MPEPPQSWASSVHQDSCPPGTLGISTAPLSPHGLRVTLSNMDADSKAANAVADREVWKALSIL